MTDTGPAYERITDALRSHGSAVRALSSRVMAACPAHDDGQASLSVTPSNGRVLIHCFAGCDTTDVLASLSLTTADLFDAPATGSARRERSTRRMVQAMTTHGTTFTREQVAYLVSLAFQSGFEHGLDVRRNASDVELVYGAGQTTTSGERDALRRQWDEQAATPRPGDFTP